MKLKTTLLGKTYTFSGVKEVLAKANEAKTGDVVALEIVDEVAEILGSTISNIACVVNPEVVVLGGGVSKAGDILVSAIKEKFQENCYFVVRDTKFVIATLGNDAGIYGCMRMLLE